MSLKKQMEGTGAAGCRPGPRGRGGLWIQRLRRVRGDQPKVTPELALQSGCAFCLAIQHGAEDAAEANNVDLTVQSPPKPEVDSQVDSCSRLPRPSRRTF